jgi:hypothetical protein
MESRKPRKTKEGAGVYIGLGRRVPAGEVKIRLQEREAREAADTRTEAQKWPGRSTTVALGAGCKALGVDFLSQRASA